MDKTNNGNNKGEKRIAVNKLSNKKGYKKTTPKFENFKGEPVE